MTTSPMLRSCLVVMTLGAAGLSGVSAQAPAVTALVAKASKYVADYEDRFSLLVAEERYSQEVRPNPVGNGGNLSQRNPGGGFSGPRGAEQRRTLRSDFLLVKLGDGGGWMPFRDVFEADGRKVHDRQSRLEQLFLRPQPSSFEQASKIMADSTRHNIGSVERTINIPTLALLFVHADLLFRFDFEAAGAETVGGVNTEVLEYRERTRPTLIKTTPKGLGRLRAAATEDLPVRGKLWIEPARGIIVKTQLIAAVAGLHSEVTVTFAEDPSTELWAPSVMEEAYYSSADEREIIGRATYSNYRRFQVNTDEKIGKPPGGQ